jgi:dihydropteroate synthase
MPHQAALKAADAAWTEVAKIIGEQSLPRRYRPSTPEQERERVAAVIAEQYEPLVHALRAVTETAEGCADHEYRLVPREALILAEKALAAFG